MRPRLFNISQEDFIDQGVFEAPSDAQLVATKLRLDNIEISDNIFKNTDCLIALPLFNLTYKGFIIDGNGQQTWTDQSTKDTNEAVIKFEIDKHHLIQIANFTVTNNYMRNGPVLYFEPVASPRERPHAQVNIQIRSGSFFANNTSEATTSCILIGDRTPWLWLKI